MFGDQNNIKNNLTDVTHNPLGIVLKDTPTPIAYTKTNKLITALYMVTDIMDTDEPIRLKLRTLGSNIISDMYSKPEQALPKISEIMSFLDIAGVVNLVSEMNANILRKEFFELKKAIEESIQEIQIPAKEVSISDLFSDTFSMPSSQFLIPQNNKSDNTSRTRIGVQKGSTLLKALKGVNMSNKDLYSPKRTSTSSADFDALKKERRDNIISIIKTEPAGATITDIRAKASGTLATCSEKTLQRELIGMLKDNLLKKTGEKRWSRYFLAS
jgi:hypothetical protein